MSISSTVLTQFTRVTDKQTDRP